MELAFHSVTEVLGAATNTVIKFNALMEKYALLADIEHVDLQNALAAVGINWNLGDFDFSIQKVGGSHAHLTELSVLNRAGYSWRWMLADICVVLLDALQADHAKCWQRGACGANGASSAIGAAKKAALDKLATVQAVAAEARAQVEKAQVAYDAVNNTVWCHKDYMSRCLSSRSSCVSADSAASMLSELPLCARSH